jgi:hypothetical protein
MLGMLGAGINRAPITTRLKRSFVDAIATRNSGRGSWRRVASSSRAVAPPDDKGPLIRKPDKCALTLFLLPTSKP